MPSDKTLTMRDFDKLSALQLRGRVVREGPMFEERDGKITRANRRARLRREKKTLSRAQRMEMREKRRSRKMTGVEPERPGWSKNFKVDPELGLLSDGGSSENDRAPNATVDQLVQVFGDGAGEALTDMVKLAAESVRDLELGSLPDGDSKGDADHGG